MTPTNEINDWSVFARAVNDWLSGVNPYLNNSSFPFINPPHSLFLFTALSWASALVAILFPALALVYVAWRRRKRHLIPIVGLSLPFILCCLYANIDWLVLVGLVIGGRVGVVLASMKPQVGAGVIVAEIARRHGLRARLWLLLPLAVLVVLTLPLWGVWLDSLRAMPSARWNVSLFPYTVPLGVVALIAAWRRQSASWGVVASVCLSPYLHITSLFPLVYVAADWRWQWGVAVSAASWGLLAYTAG